MNLLTDNLWEEVDFGHCKRDCQNGRDYLNREGLCEDCFNERKCCVPVCGNQYHVEGEGGCSVHELDAAREDGDAARIALWEAYVAADKTLPAPTLKPLQSDCWGFTDPIAQQVMGPIFRSIFGGGR